MKSRRKSIAHHACALGALRMSGAAHPTLCTACRGVVGSSPVGFLMREKILDRWVSKICDDCRRRVDARHDLVITGRCTFAFDK